MDVETKHITDFFPLLIEEDDYFSRLHVHMDALNTSYLKKYGFANELTLLQAIKDWLKNKPSIRIAANAAYKESKAVSQYS